MGKKLVALLAGAMAALAGAAFAFPNEPDGFRGLTWGQDIAAIPDLAYTSWQSPADESIKTFHETLDYKVYERKNDELRIGSVALSGIRYLAWQGKLRGVIVPFPPAEKDDFLKLLTARYGKPRLDRRERRTVYNWSGEKTTMELIEEFKVTEFRMHSTQLAHEERKNRREHAVRRLREKETLDRKAIEQGEGF